MPTLCVLLHYWFVTPSARWRLMHEDYWSFVFVCRRQNVPVHNLAWRCIIKRSLDFLNHDDSGYNYSADKFGFFIICYSFFTKCMDPIYIYTEIGLERILHKKRGKESTSMTARSIRNFSEWVSRWLDHWATARTYGSEEHNSVLRTTAWSKV